VENIWPFSLRELLWRANALKEDAWNRVAWICLHVARPHMKDPPSVPFHPKYAGQETSSLSDFEKLREEKVLPVQLTEAEKEARWQAHLKRERERDYERK
jgi:hypothetical protein